jgi:DNA processing protein
MNCPAGATASTFDHPALDPERSAWLRLTLTPGLGPATARRLLAVFGLPDAIFAASAATLTPHAGDILARELAGPASPAQREAMQATARWLASSLSNHLLTLADPLYPAGLLAMSDPPPVLYAIGQLDLLARPGLAIVGSRSATRQGEATAEAFAAGLARAGLAIVSGLALGIDAAAHRGALDAAGGTIAVVGTGADVVYPATNRALTTRIRAQGLVLSELPLGTPAIAFNFPRRNRLIAGLARGVLVVEAALRSGSLITARLAAEQGREVFAIPGSIHSPVAKGCHRLIREGAKLVESVQDILEELRIAPAVTAAIPAGTTGSAATATDPPSEASPAEPRAPAQQALLDALGHDPASLDALAERTGRPAGELSALLLELELTQDVERLPGDRYQRLR